jgi:hypothetical protein
MDLDMGRVGLTNGRRPITGTPGHESGAGLIDGQPSGDPELDPKGRGYAARVLHLQDDVGVQAKGDQLASTVQQRLPGPGDEHAIAEHGIEAAGKAIAGGVEGGRRDDDDRRCLTY